MINMNIFVSVIFKMKAKLSFLDENFVIKFVMNKLFNFDLLLPTWNSRKLFIGRLKLVQMNGHTF